MRIFFIKLNKGGKAWDLMTIDAYIYWMKIWLLRYCSQECHEKDWENHKQDCLEIRAREKNDDNAEKNDKKMFDIDDVD